MNNHYNNHMDKTTLYYKRGATVDDISLIVCHTSLEIKNIVSVITGAMSTSEAPKGYLSHISPLHHAGS